MTRLRRSSGGAPGDRAMRAGSPGLVARPVVALAPAAAAAARPLTRARPSQPRARSRSSARQPGPVRGPARISPSRSPPAATRSRSEPVAVERAEQDRGAGGRAPAPATAGRRSARRDLFGGRGRRSAPGRARIRRLREGPVREPRPDPQQAPRRAADGDQLRRRERRRRAMTAATSDGHGPDSSVPARRIVPDVHAGEARGAERQPDGHRAGRAPASRTSVLPPPTSTMDGLPQDGPPAWTPMSATSASSSWLRTPTSRPVTPRISRDRRSGVGAPAAAGRCPRS